MSKSTRDFCIVLDRTGNILSIEYGNESNLSQEVRSIARAAAECGVGHLAFVWTGEPSAHPLRIELDVALFDSAEHVTVLGEECRDLPYGLSLRELDVLTLVATGASNPSIATAMYISVRTVTTHIDHLMRKLGVSSRTTAATMAIDQGLLKAPFPPGADGYDVLGIGRAIHAAEAPSTHRISRARRPIHRRPLMIGAAIPLAGFASEDGKEMANASRLAIDELNERGGVGGRMLQLEIAPVDILSSASIRTAFRTLAESDVDVLMSGYLTHQSVAHEIAAESGIPYLHAATSDTMENAVLSNRSRYERVFQVCPSESNYAPRFVEVMSELRDRGEWAPSSRRLTIIENAWGSVQNDTGFNLGIELAERLAEKHKWDIDVLRPQPGMTSWAEFATHIRHLEPAAVLIGHCQIPGLAEFLETFLADPSDTLLYSLYAPSVREFRSLLGSKVEGLLWATVTGTYSDSFAQRFASNYFNAFGSSPGRSHAGIAYDRINLMANAWAQVPIPHDRSRVAQELKRQVYRGVNGVYYLGSGSQTALSYTHAHQDPSLSQAHLVFQIQSGHQRILSPLPYADAHFQAPHWLTKTREIQKSGNRSPIL